MQKVIKRFGANFSGQLFDFFAQLIEVVLVGRAVSLLPAMPCCSTLADKLNYLVWVGKQGSRVLCRCCSSSSLCNDCLNIVHRSIDFLWCLKPIMQVDAIMHKVSEEVSLEVIFSD